MLAIISQRLQDGQHFTLIDRVNVTLPDDRQNMKFKRPPPRIGMVIAAPVPAAFLVGTLGSLAECRHLRPGGIQAEKGILSLPKSHPVVMDDLSRFIYGDSWVIPQVVIPAFTLDLNTLYPGLCLPTDTKV